jgi:hypothetical protein
MDEMTKTERKREVQRRLRDQRQRLGLLRRRAVALSLIAFVLLWGVVFTQMVTGNDPVLGSAQAPNGAARVAAETIETSAPEEIETEVVEPERVEEEAPIELEPEPEPAPVTTGQS